MVDAVNNNVEDVKRRIIAIVNEHIAGSQGKEINLESKFVNDLGADSLDLVELVMAFEEEFGCEIPDNDAEKIATVGDAVTYVSSKVSQQ